MFRGAKIMTQTKNRKKRFKSYWQKVAVIVARRSITVCNEGQIYTDLVMHEILHLLSCIQDKFLPTFFFLKAFWLCVSADGTAISVFPLLSFRISKHILVLFFVCFILKNNLRRINCTVTEVKYFLRSSNTFILAAHFRVFYLFLRFVFLIQLKVWTKFSLCYDSCSFALLCFYAVLLSFFCSIHWCSTSFTSAHFNTAALLIYPRSKTAKRVLHHSNRTFSFL